MTYLQIVVLHGMMMTHLRLAISASILAGNPRQTDDVRAWARENAVRHMDEMLRVAGLLRAAGVNPL